MKHYHPIDGVSSTSSSYRWSNIIVIISMKIHYPTNGASLSLSYQWMSIILPMDRHHYLTNGSTLFYRRIFIIILSTDLCYHHPTNGSSSIVSYQWIIVNPLIDEVVSSSSCRWSSIIILSMNNHYPIN
ncbi:hypothetical protein KY290_028025 [Solanum tuberosum]|uniref:Uncharacterized protein n=1 Tax=Solanum tuberosum TaxID=4113 RepID=A0ABQ7UIK3_SOLTU|nr:hypothetical protein KY290_028025 [Solanum tuberosum]